MPLMAGLCVSIPSTVGKRSRSLARGTTPLATVSTIRCSVLSTALELGWWPIAVLVLAASLLAVIYVWRVVEVAYFKPAPAGREAVTEAPLSMLIPTWTLIGASVYFGIHTDLTVGVARRAALSLR